MIKVKDFLDNNFISNEPSTSTLKYNGNYSVFGSWTYHRLDLVFDDEIIPIVENRKILNGVFSDYNIFSNSNIKRNFVEFKIFCSCNNETIQVHITENKKFIGLYGYFQTYLHIPRGEPDENGYYQRSTDEEIIKYLNSFIIPRTRYQKLYQLV